MSSQCDSNTGCSSCSGATGCDQTNKEAHEQAMLTKRMADIRYKFLVISGKGGVGKSSDFAVNLASNPGRTGP